VTDTKKKIWYSELQFRYNPADPAQGTIDLGWALEFMTSHYWVVGLALRAALDEKRFSDLDELTRKLLDHRMDVMTRELEQVLQKAQRLGDVLKALAARNPWSLHVASPRWLHLTASEQKASDKSSAEKLTEDYVCKILEVTKREKPQESEAQHGESEQLDVTAPWMLPAKTMKRALQRE
jgi:hypothetical protein